MFKSYVVYSALDPDEDEEEDLYASLRRDKNIVEIKPDFKP
jgi:hypothetical protein